MKTFADFGVADTICTALTQAGILNPFPIQELTLPLALAGADLIGQARTGTGKTLAFGIPLLQRIRDEAGAPAPRALVVVPTRELCLQVSDDLAAAGAHTGLVVLPVYGGKSLEAQVDALTKGVDIVVGTPGRLLDLLRRGSLVLSGVTQLVLDEADEMLDLGFLPDVEQLIQATATGRQTLLFSATMPSAVVALARRYMNKPTFLRADVEEVRIGPDTVQHFFSCHRMDKPAVLARILRDPSRGLCVVFSRTKRMADMLVEDLRAQSVNAAAIHSDLRQDARERALKSFRSGKIDVLVATEVAARGLDISDVTHVVNYDCPDDEKMYLHRIGRTGRAGAAGVAITLAVWNELARLEMIKKTLGITDPTHEVFSTSPILDELFDLPPRETVRREAPKRQERAGRAERSDRPERSDRADRQRAAATQTEPDAEATSSDQPAQDPPEPARRSRRSRGGRGRGRAAAGVDLQASADDAQSADVVAEQAPAGDAPVPDGAPPGGSGDSGDSGDSGEIIRRVRTRRRPVAGATLGREPSSAQAPERDAGAAPDAPADAPADAPRPSGATRSRRRNGAAGNQGGQGSGAIQRRSGTDQPSGRTAPGGSAEKGRRRTERARPDRADRRTEGQRRDGRRTPAAAAVDAEEARGVGRPRLTRPLVISYLP